MQAASLSFHVILDHLSLGKYRPLEQSGMLDHRYQYIRGSLEQFAVDVKLAGIGIVGKYKVKEFRK